MFNQYNSIGRKNAKNLYRTKSMNIYIANFQTNPKLNKTEHKTNQTKRKTTTYVDNAIFFCILNDSKCKMELDLVWFMALTCLIC